MDECHQTLVSVVVVAYNAETTITSALDSVLKQTYQKIELIICDDKSSDKTVALSEVWIAKNAERFERVEIIKAAANTGVTANCNRGFKSARGDYIKFFSADDILLPHCIEAMSLEMAKKSADIAFSYQYILYGNNEQFLYTNYEEYLDKRPTESEVNDFFVNPTESTYLTLLKSNCFPAPTAMINMDYLSKFGGFDTKYPNMEDYPFWLKAAKADAKIIFVECDGVLYRKSLRGVSFMNETPSVAQSRFQKDLQALLDNEINPELNLHGLDSRSFPTSVYDESVLSKAISLDFAIAKYRLLGSNEEPRLIQSIQGLRHIYQLLLKELRTSHNARTSQNAASCHAQNLESELKSINQNNEFEAEKSALRYTYIKALFLRFRKSGFPKIVLAPLILFSRQFTREVLHRQ